MANFELYLCRHVWAANGLSWYDPQKSYWYNKIYEIKIFLEIFYNLLIFLGKALIDGRSNLIENKKGKRAFIRTACGDGNKIDTLFVDQRTSSGSADSSRFGSISQFEDSDDNNNYSNNENGKYLVICCDGNASFYEVGCFAIPIEKGYSTLGWNYPGFGESTVIILLLVNVNEIKTYQ